METDCLVEVKFSGIVDIGTLYSVHAKRYLGYNMLHYLGYEGRSLNLNTKQINHHIVLHSFTTCSYHC